LSQWLKDLRRKDFSLIYLGVLPKAKAEMLYLEEVVAIEP